MSDLGSLIERLQSEVAVSPDKVVRVGFTHPHSYRGYYDELAFEPVDNVRIAAMLEVALSAVGETYMGYKGGNYTMGRWTQVWLAEYGSCGEQLGARLIEYMLADVVGHNA